MKNHPPLQYGNFYHLFGNGVDKCKLFKETSDYQRFIIDYQRYINVIADTYAWCLMPNHFHFLVRIKDERDIKCFSGLNLTETLKNYDRERKTNSKIINTKTDNSLENTKDLTQETIPNLNSFSQKNGNCVKNPLTKPPLGETTAIPSPEPPPGTQSTGGVVHCGHCGIVHITPFKEKDNVSDVKNISCNWMTKKPKPSNQLSHLLNSYAQYFNHKYKRQGALFEKRFKRKKVENISYLRKLVIYIHQNPVHHKFVSHPIEYP